VRPIPVFVNAGAGSADAAAAAVSADPRFRLRRVPAGELLPAVAAALDGGDDRVVVAGGDGTLAAVAALAVERSATLGVVPGGTLNHFARAHGLPTDPAAALETAVGGVPRAVDVGYVNGRLFLNTSAVGAYPVFVRRRERLERRLGYRAASVAAAVWTAWRLPRLSVRLEAAGRSRELAGPLVFVGVGERELHARGLGLPERGGARGLHVLAVRGSSRLRLLGAAVRALAPGARPWSRGGRVESLVVQRCEITLPRGHGRVALDGETAYIPGTLRYELARDALRVMMPE
jgi:diacylglycerol kinase family enzyme